MTITGMLMLLLLIVVLGCVAYWIITKFMPEPIRTPALAIVGVLLLILLLSQAWPGAATYRLWR